MKLQNFSLKASLVAVSALTFLTIVSSINAATTHVVISQVQVAGATATDEFVELYNPTGGSVDIVGWRLTKKISTGGQTTLVASMSGSIASHKYMLITPQTGYTGSTTADKTYSSSTASVTANNTVLLYSDTGVTVVDKVGMGTATDSETATVAEPVTSGSIQRKVDDTNGQGLDTNNNSTDFEELAVSTPRNSSTVVATPTPTASPTSSPTPSATPTDTPTSSPTPTTSPTGTPTATPTSSPAPSVTPTSTPTATPTPTQPGTPIPTVTPTPSVSPTPVSGSVIGVFNFPDLKVECRIHYTLVHDGFFFGIFPSVTCTKVL